MKSQLSYMMSCPSFKATLAVVHLALCLPIGVPVARAMIVDEDNRREIEHFSLSKDELAAMYQIVGSVECRRGNVIGGGTAFVIDGGRHLLSNAHVFREGDQQCTFSRKHSNQIIALRVDKAIAGTKNLMRAVESRPKDPVAQSRDWVIVPLTTQITTPTYKLGVAPQNGEELFLVGVLGDGKELDNSRLVGRRCTVEERRSSAAGQETLVTNCDTIPGDSGAPIFIRRNGVLEVVAINRAHHALAIHGKISVVDRDMTFGLVIDGPLREVIDNRFAAAPSVALLRPYHDPNYRPLLISPKPDVGRPEGRIILAEPAPPDDELVLDGMKLRDLTPDDQILYGIPDDVRGVIVASVGSKTDFAEGDVLLGQTLAHLLRQLKFGTVSLMVDRRTIEGRTEKRTLSLQ